MEATADAFLVAAQSEAILSANMDQTSDDDRSSSLSDPEDLPDYLDGQLLPVQPAASGDNDSEAETERLEESPDKLIAQKKLAMSSSRLGKSTTVEQDLDEDAFSDSAISSPLPSEDISLDGELEEEDSAQGNAVAEQERSEIIQSAKKRKRSLLSGDFIDGAEDQLRRKRTRSLKSNADDSSENSGDEDIEPGIVQREASADIEREDQANNDSDVSNDDEAPLENASAPEPVRSDSEKKTDGPRRALRRKTGEQEDQSPNQDIGNQAEDAEGSEEDEIDEGDEADDADAIAKGEEEALKRMAAMESLTALEKHFATLRDRLYDERIAVINQELAQLASSKPTHPDLLRQIECVEKYRDDKFEMEQKLLVYRVGALKRKSVAERSQIHSAYFQTARDLREKHLERISEHFYRIQRDRYKTEDRNAEYTIPFPEKRSVQVAQQTAYNKEVSILSGVAKYVGFPAAPELPNARQGELEQDLEKMGISVRLPNTKQPRKTLVGNPFASSISQPAAEEQFLEQTPWANPQHPSHRQRMQMSRQASNQSPFNESLATPAHQQRLVDTSAPAGSASTIVETASAQASSAINTPHDDQVDPRNGSIPQGNYRLQSLSPFDTRRAASATLPPSNIGRNSPQPRTAGSSPLASRAAISGSPPRVGALPPDRVPRNDTTSPSIMNRFGRDPGGATGVGPSRLGLR